MRKTVEKVRTASAQAVIDQSTDQTISLRGTALYTVAYLLCILISLAPLRRLAGVNYLALPTNEILTLPGSWLPIDLHLTPSAHASQLTTHVIFFLLFIGLAFLVYGLFARHLAHQPQDGNYRHVQRVIWATTILLGFLFVIMPAMLSHDIFVYVGYGRVLTIHHTNPYFITLSTFPQDSFFRLDDWRSAQSAYGPVWLAICGLAALVIGDDPGRALIVYRLLALCSHLLNMLLVVLILRKMGQSSRTVTLGMLLYAWNPLVLEEASLGGHNDAFMVTLLLLGVLFSVQTEQHPSLSLTRLRGYLPALTAFTLAALVKFTAFPVVALYFVLLARMAFAAPAVEPLPRKDVFLSRLRAVVRTIVPAGAFSALLALLLYAPYWVGASLDSIVYSFTSPPSSTSSDGSIMYAIVTWVKDHGYPPQNSWSYPLLYTLSHHQTWNTIGFVTLAALLVVSALWIWRTPTLRTFALASVATLGAVLIVTFWFFAWYTTWLVGLAAICLPVRDTRLARAIVGSALVFSASGLFLYLYANNIPPVGGWTGFSFLTTIGPPILAYLLLLVLPNHTPAQPQATQHNSNE